MQYNARNICIKICTQYTNEFYKLTFVKITILIHSKIVILSRKATITYNIKPLIQTRCSRCARLVEKRSTLSSLLITNFNFGLHLWTNSVSNDTVASGKSTGGFESVIESATTSARPTTRRATFSRRRGWNVDSSYKNLLGATAHLEGALLLTASRRGSWHGH